MNRGLYNLLMYGTVMPNLIPDLMYRPLLNIQPQLMSPEEAADLSWNYDPSMYPPYQSAYMDLWRNAEPQREVNWHQSRARLGQESQESADDVARFYGYEPR